MFSDALQALKKALSNNYRIDRLSNDLAQEAQEIRSELATIQAEQRDLRDRISRMEGAFQALYQYSPPNR